MTTVVLRRIGRVWTTLLVVYGLLLSGLQPLPAVAGPVRADGVICTGGALAAAPSDPSDADHDDRHGAPCCILCQVPASLGPRTGDATVARPLPVRVAAPVAPGPSPHPARASPGAVPQSPRAPPILS